MNWKTLFSPTVVIALVVTVSGCSQLGPNDGELIKSLQSKLPPYWEVASLSFENTENLGSKSDPIIKARFKGTIKLKEDTFTDGKTNGLFNMPFGNFQQTTNIIFISPVERKGKITELFGVATSKRFTDTWATEFRFDNNPMAELGEPRSFFKGKTILKNSPEETAYKVAKRKELLSKLTAREFSGIYVLNYFSNGLTIRFTSANPDSQNISGQISFDRGATKGFEGTLSDTELKFTVNKELQGKDTFGVGTVYTFPLENISSNSTQLGGKWKHVDNQTGTVIITFNQ